MSDRYSKCSRCDGKGTVPDINLPMAIFTCGVTALVDLALDARKPCAHCAGLGYHPHAEGGDA